MKDDCAINSHYLNYKFLFKRLRECTFWTWKWKGLKQGLLLSRLRGSRNPNRTANPPQVSNKPEVYFGLVCRRARARHPSYRCHHGRKGARGSAESTRTSSDLHAPPWPQRRVRNRRKCAGNCRMRRNAQNNWRTEYAGTTPVSRCNYLELFGDLELPLFGSIPFLSIEFSQLLHFFLLHLERAELFLALRPPTFFLGRVQKDWVTTTWTATRLFPRRFS